MQLPARQHSYQCILLQLQLRLNEEFTNGGVAASMKQAFIPVVPAGAVPVGAVWSSIVIICEQVAELPASSITA
jgi:hypothetical protein